MFFHLPHYHWPKQWPIQQAYELKEMNNQQTIRNKLMP